MPSASSCLPAWMAAQVAGIRRRTWSLSTPTSEYIFTNCRPRATSLSAAALQACTGRFQAKVPGRWQRPRAQQQMLACVQTGKQARDFQNPIDRCEARVNGGQHHPFLLHPGNAMTCVKGDARVHLCADATGDCFQEHATHIH